MYENENVKGYLREMYLDEDKMLRLEKYYQQDSDYTHKVFSDDPKVVTIVRGLPGSGKSTYVRETFPDAVVVSADDFFMNENGEYVFVRWKIGEAHQTCWSAFINAVFNGERNIVVDNTNMCIWEYANYCFLARKMGYEIEIRTMKAGLTDDTELKTLAERNTHGVDLKTIQAMKERFEPDYGEEYV